jgi:hypothetical protein
VEVKQDLRVSIGEPLGELARNGRRFVKELGFDVGDEDAMCREVFGHRPPPRSIVRLTAWHLVD